MGCPNNQTQQKPEEPQAEHAPVFDCDKGFPGHVDGWSADKKAQCCERQSRGCPNEEAPERQAEHVPVFDCDKGFPGHVDVWSADKKAQCCERQSRGCPS